MRGKEATPGSGNYAGAKSVAETRSIVANREMFRLAVLSALFALTLLAVPTAMAVTKQWGWW